MQFRYNNDDGVIFLIVSDWVNNFWQLVLQKNKIKVSHFTMIALKEKKKIF